MSYCYGRYPVTSSSKQRSSVGNSNKIAKIEQCISGPLKEPLLDIYVPSVQHNPAQVDARGRTSQSQPNNSLPHRRHYVSGFRIVTII